MAAQSSTPIFDHLESPSGNPNGRAGKEVVVGLEAQRPSPSEIKPENLSEPWCLQRPKRRRGRQVGPVSEPSEAEVQTLKWDESSTPIFDHLESPSGNPNGRAGKEVVVGLEAQRPSPSEIKPENLSEPWCLQRPKRRRGRQVGPVSEPSEAEVQTLKWDGSVPSVIDGVDFKCQTIDFKCGEDLSKWIESHIKEHSRAVYIVSAIGKISRVALRHAGSGNVHLLQGDLDIIFLTGICLPNWIGQSGYTGGLKACLQTPTGENVTGLIGDTLIAGSTVQVVFLSFSIDHRLKGKKRNGAHLKGKKRKGARPATGASAQVS